MSDIQADIQALSSSLSGLEWFGNTDKTKLAWEKQQRDSPLGTWTHFGVEGNEQVDRLVRKGSMTSLPLLGLEPYCGLRDAIFKEKLIREVETRRDRVWRETEGQK